MVYGNDAGNFRLIMKATEKLRYEWRQRTLGERIMEIHGVLDCLDLMDNNELKQAAFNIFMTLQTAYDDFLIVYIAVQRTRKDGCL